MYCSVLELDRPETLEDPETVISSALRQCSVVVVEGGETFYLQRYAIWVNFRGLLLYTVVVIFYI